MIISNKQVQNVMKVYGEQTKVASSAKSGKTSPTQKQDEVILSSSVQEFGKVFQSIREMSGVREDRVKELSAAIDAGTYQVDAKAVAEKMIGRALADDVR